MTELHKTRSKIEILREQHCDPGRRHLEDLQRLLPLWPSELADRTIEGRARLIANIERALRGERRRARINHWSYDLARHSALARILRLERAEFLEMAARRASRPSGTRSQPKLPMAAADDAGSASLLAPGTKPHLLGKL